MAIVNGVGAVLMAIVSGVVAVFDGELARVELFVELSRVDYLRLVDYGLADALPSPLPLAPRGGKRVEQSAGSSSVRR